MHYNYLKNLNWVLYDLNKVFLYSIILSGIFFVSYLIGEIFSAFLFDLSENVFHSRGFLLYYGNLLSNNFVLFGISEIFLFLVVD